MIVKQEQALLQAKQKFALIYGTDDGRTAQLADRMRQQFTGEIIKLNGEECDKQPNRLASLLQSASLFADTQMIWLDARDDRLKPEFFTQIVKTIETHKDSTNHLLILAGGLAKKSKLPKFFENDKDCISIVCYALEPQQIAGWLEDMLKQDRLTIAADAKQLFIDKAKGNSAQIAHEIAKLRLYKNPGEQIVFEDVQQMTAGVDELQLNDLIYAAFSGRVSQLQKLLRGQNPEPIVLVYVIRKHIALLKEIRQQAQARKVSERTIIDSMKPQIFFKLKDSLQSQAKQWRESRLLKFYDKTLEIELQAKGQPIQGNAAAAMLLFDIARQSG